MRNITGSTCMILSSTLMLMYTLYRTRNTPGNHIDEKIAQETSTTNSIPSSSKTITTGSISAKEKSSITFSGQDAYSASGDIYIQQNALSDKLLKEAINKVEAVQSIAQKVEKDFHESKLQNEKMSQDIAALIHATKELNEDIQKIKAGVKKSKEAIARLQGQIDGVWKQLDDIRSSLKTIEESTSTTKEAMAKFEASFNDHRQEVNQKLNDFISLMKLMGFALTTVILGSSGYVVYKEYTRSPAAP